MITLSSLASLGYRALLIHMLVEIVATITTTVSVAVLFTSSFLSTIITIDWILVKYRGKGLMDHPPRTGSDLSSHELMSLLEKRIKEGTRQQSLSHKEWCLQKIRSIEFSEDLESDGDPQAETPIDPVASK